MRRLVALFASRRVEGEEVSRSPIGPIIEQPATTPLFFLHFRSFSCRADFDQSHPMCLVAALKALALFSFQGRYFP
jgi:hypothetical protein